MAAGHQHWPGGCQKLGALLDTAAEEDLAPPEGRGSGLPAASWEQHLAQSKCPVASHKTRLEVDEEEGKVGTQQWKQEAGVPETPRDLPRAAEIGGNPHQSAGRPEVCKTAWLPAHLSPRRIHRGPEAQRSLCEFRGQVMRSLKDVLIGTQSPLGNMEVRGEGRGGEGKGGEGRGGGRE